MREILFRGFCPNENGTDKVFINGEWINGWWIYGYCIRAKRKGSGKKHTFIIPTGTLINEDCYSFVLATKVEVIPETLGEYAGNTDKNDNKIFEGDIFRCKDDAKTYHYFYLSFIDGAFKVKSKRMKYFETELTRVLSKSFEVVGNIHSNPELLEVTE